MVLNSLFVNFWFLCQIWMRTLLGRVFLEVFPFHHFKYIVPFLSGPQTVEKSADNLTVILSYVICCFSLVAFKVFSLIFVHLIMMCLGVFPPLVGPLWYSLHFLNLYDCFLFHVRGVFSCHLFNIFSSPISLSSPSGTPIMWMLLHLVVSQWSLKWSSFVFL